MTVFEEDARRALAAKNDAQASLADIVECPPWRHAVFAALMAALVLTPALPLPLRFAVLVAAFATIVFIVRSDRRRLGVFVNGYRRGKTQRVVFPLLALFMLEYGASVYAGDVLGRPAFSIALTIVTFGTAYAGSVLWQNVFSRELRA